MFCFDERFLFLDLAMIHIKLKMAFSGHEKQENWQETKTCYHPT